jgi:hypothetical protein
MVQSPGAKLLISLALLAAAARGSMAQGGWAQWDIKLRDGTRVEANPLGAPDTAHFAISVGGMEGHDVTVLRSLVDYIAAQTTVGPRRESLQGAKLPSLPAARACDDIIVLRDGTLSHGHVTFARVQYSAGTVRQRGADIDLARVAYIRFGRRSGDACKKVRNRRSASTTSQARVPL